MLPFAYVLTSRKTGVEYRAVLSYIRNVVASILRPSVIMTDFESALYRTLMDVYPEAEVHGCFFHFCQVSFVHIIKQLLSSYY